MSNFIFCFIKNQYAFEMNHKIHEKSFLRNKRYFIKKIQGYLTRLNDVVGQVATLNAGKIGMREA